MGRGNRPHKNMIRGLTIALVVLGSFIAGSVKADTTNGLSEAEIQGRQLARELCDGQPADNYTNTGVLQIRGEDGQRFDVPIKCWTRVAPSVWQSFYEAKMANATVALVVNHAAGRPNSYFYNTNSNYGERIPQFSGTPLLGRFFLGQQVSGAALMEPFAGSDFWFADLGLEFFHWPEQKVLPKTTSLKRGRAYTLLESINPNPATNNYSRVLSWVDLETGGILEAEAYDAKGHLLKVFEPKSFKKINGQWELQEMEIRNVQTGSRTRLEFDLKK